MRRAQRAKADNVGGRDAVAPQIEDYTPERIAEFLLNNAVDARDYEASAAQVRATGIDPDTIPHAPPQ